MINKKICMLGAFAVGKTSLVQQYVHSIFSDSYLSTIGVKISKKLLSLEDAEINLILWDMEGKDIYADINTSYLRGAMGFFAVADGTRKETLDMALSMRSRTLEVAGPIPHMLLINKADLMPGWEVTEDDLAALEGQGISIARTSARTCLGVEDSFAGLARAIMTK